MSSPTYVNENPVPMTLGDIGNPILFQIGDGQYAPTDYSGYPNLVVSAVLTAKQDLTIQYATVHCTVVDAALGQFLFPGFPKGVLAYNSITDRGTAPGSYELSFQVDYYGDGTTRVSSVEGMLTIRLYDARPST